MVVLAICSLNKKPINEEEEGSLLKYGLSLGTYLSHCVYIIFCPLVSFFIHTLFIFLSYFNNINQY